MMPCCALHFRQRLPASRPRPRRLRLGSACNPRVPAPCRFVAASLSSSQLPKCRAELGRFASPPIERLYPTHRPLTREQLDALLCPAFTLDVTGGLGVAVFELMPDERTWFDRDALRRFALGIP